MKIGAEGKDIYVYRGDVANNALKMAGQEIGLFTDKSEITHRTNYDDLSDVELVRMLQDVGPGGRDEAGKLTPIDLKVGDRVLFGKWSGTEVKLDGEELLIMKESDIMGVITDIPAAKKKAA